MIAKFWYSYCKNKGHACEADAGAESEQCCLASAWNHHAFKSSIKIETYVIQLHQNNDNNLKRIEDGGGGGLRNGLSSISHHKIVAGEERQDFSCDLIRCLFPFSFTYKRLLHNLICHPQLN